MNYPDPDEYNDDFEDPPFDYDHEGWDTPIDTWGTDESPIGFDDR
jgi:hypothetical protein|nr:MAG: hypothetical protein [Caudoviricetes sp.]